MNQCLNFLNGKELQDSVFLNPTNFCEVNKIIQKFKNKSSTGLDNISPKLLKYFPDNIIHCLVYIFNLSMLEGKFISCFKKAKVVPIYKSKDKQAMDNFRPISLLPVISKILEKIIYIRVYLFLSRNVFFFFMKISMALERVILLS